MKTFSFICNSGSAYKTPRYGRGRSLFLSSTLLFLFLVAGFVSLGQNPKLWGVTPTGGANDDGVIFEYDPLLNTVVVMHHFDRHTNGSHPAGGLIQAENGMLYGLATNGLTDNLGVLYEYNPFTGVYTVKYDFKDDDNGGSPSGTLLQASDGNLYGLAGVIFRYNIATGTYTRLYEFPQNAQNGIASIAFGNLIEGSNGKLYGMAQNGGANNDGVIFEFDLATNTYSQKIDFDHFVTGGFRGRMINTPFGIYGTKSGGGPNNRGTIFTYDPVNNLYTVIYDFDANDNTGQVPHGEILLANNGLFYGLTGFGGNFNDGILFQLDRFNNTAIQKYDFDESSLTGKNPDGSLIQASNGKIYGMTQYGGQDGNGDPVNDGVIFEFDPAGNVISKTFYFDDNNGENPYRSKLLEVDFTPPAIQGPISIVSDAAWAKSTVVTTATANSYPWSGINSLPAVNTFTLAAEVGQPYPWEPISAVAGSQVIKAGSGVEYYRQVFELVDNSNLAVRFRMFVDDDMEIFINGHSLAREEDIGPDNFRTPNHDMRFNSDGTVDNGYQGGDLFDDFSSENLNQVFEPGANEIVLAIRNRTSKPDIGGFSFRMDLVQEDPLPKAAPVEVLPENPAIGFHLFPNPTMALVTISLLEEPTGAALALVFDFTGKLLFSQVLSKDLQLDMSEYSGGVYLVKVVEGNKTYAQKLIRQ